MSDTNKEREARDRLAAYIERRKQSRGLDIDSIHGFDIGPDCGFELRLSDIELLLTPHPETPAPLRDEAVGTLTISKFRGHLENHDFDYYGGLPEGTHHLYAAPMPQSAGVMDALQELLNLRNKDRGSWTGAWASAWEKAESALRGE